jgi:hypothetical protein
MSGKALQVKAMWRISRIYHGTHTTISKSTSPLLQDHHPIQHSVMRAKLDPSPAYLSLFEYSGITNAFSLLRLQRVMAKTNSFRDTDSDSSSEDLDSSSPLLHWSGEIFC